MGAGQRRGLPLTGRTPGRLDARPHQAGWPAPDRPLVLVSMGSAYTADLGFYRACAEALGDGTRRVVIALGGHFDPADLGELPDGVEQSRER
jgi:UDP:flavonoid glycosyltransferase YjiC (YdhE family)